MTFRLDEFIRIVVVAILGACLLTSAHAQYYGGPILFRVAGGASAIGTPTSIGTTGVQPSGGTSASLVTLTTTGNINSGDLVVVCVGLFTNNSVTASSVSDGTNSYTKAAGIQYFSNTNQTSLWYFNGAAAVGSGATITVNLSGVSGANLIGNIQAARVSGVLASSALDVTPTNSVSGANTSLSVSSGTLAQAKEILFGCAQNTANTDNTAYSGASGFTNLSTAGQSNGAVATLDYQTVNSTASVAYNPTWVAGVNGIGEVLSSFKGK